MMEKGSVTVFLSFVFVPILSLILVMLEGARCSAAAAGADMQLTTCVESLMGEFYRPLYEQYGLFAIDATIGGKVPDLNGLEDIMKSYDAGDSFGLKIDKCSITGTKPFLTPGGSEFMRQALAHEKYCAAVDTVDAFLERFAVFSKEGAVYKVYERQMEIENKLALIDQNTLLLMEKADGIVCSGLTVGDVNTDFVKAFMILNPDPVTVGINNPEIWTLLEDKYYSPYVFIDSAMSKLESTRPLIEERESLKRSKEALLCDREGLAQAVTDLEEEIKKRDTEKESGAENGKAQESDAENGKAQESDVGRDRELELRYEKAQQQLQECDEDIQELSEQINEKNDAINELALTAGIQTDELMRRVSGCALAAKEAFELVEQDAEIIEQTRPLVETFETFLEESKDYLSKDTYDSIEVSLKRMKRYTGLDSNRPEYELIRETLNNDIGILQEIESDVFISAEIAKSVRSQITQTDVERWSCELKLARDAAGRYSYDGLVFDYSDYKPDRLLNTLSDSLTQTVSKGFLGLITDTSKISEKKLDVRTRPSDVMGQAGPEFFDVEDVLTDAVGRSSGAESFLELDATRPFSGSAGLIDSPKSSFSDKLLLMLYIRDHFADYFDKAKSAKSALSYELEYILWGNNSDAANLAQSAYSILKLRMMTSGAYVITNASLHSQASKIATGIVGFTGLHFLVAIVKYAILFVWTVEQALVETAAILAGKKVPVLTTSESFCIGTVESVAMSGALIKEKAKVFKESPFCLTYGDYMLIFMLSSSQEELCLNSMNMIEENMRWAYDEDFMLATCISGFDATVEMSCPARYVGIFGGIFADKEVPGGYGFVRSDSVLY